MADQPRDPKNGEFASGSSGGEVAARVRKRYSVEAHAGKTSVGTHAGKDFMKGLAKAALGITAGAVGTIARSALRSQRMHGRR
jgi:hypothetical protein